MPSDSLVTVAGPAGVGALCMLGVFLFLDGRAPSLFPTVEEYAKTTTWSVVAAVPILAIAYVFGLSVMSIGVLVVHAIFGTTAAVESIDISRIGLIQIDKSAAVQRYLELLRNRSVMAASAIALLILSLGALSEMSNLPHLKPSVVTLSIGTIALSCLLFWLSGKNTNEAHQLAALIVELRPCSSPASD